MTGINECIRERLSASHRAQQCPHWTPKKFMFMLIVAAVPYTSEKCLVFMVMLAFDFRANPPPPDIGGGPPLRKRNKGVQCECVLRKYFFREESVPVPTIWNF